jgi:hypothetical protein
MRKTRLEVLAILRQTKINPCHLKTWGVPIDDRMLPVKQRMPPSSTAPTRGRSTPGRLVSRSASGASPSTN